MLADPHGILLTTPPSDSPPPPSLLPHNPHPPLPPPSSSSLHRRRRRSRTTNPISHTPQQEEEGECPISHTPLPEGGGGFTYEKINPSLFLSTEESSSPPPSSEAPSTLSFLFSPGESSVSVRLFARSKQITACLRSFSAIGFLHFSLIKRNSLLNLVCLFYLNFGVLSP